jgi:drug/metabolite transporter (DMT)-like permease
MSSTLKAHISLLTAQIIYALNYSIAKDLMPNYVKPLALVMLRIGGALVLFWLLSFISKAEKIDKKDLQKLALLAVCGVAANQAFFIYGLSLTKPINSAIIMVSNPIAVMLFGIIVLKDRLTIYKISGLSLGVIGALALLLFKAEGSVSFGSETIIGDLMTLANSLFWAAFVVLVKPLMIKYKTVTVMKWVFLFGFIYMLPFGLKDSLQINWLELPNNVIYSILFVVVATTFLAYILNTYALKALSSEVVSMYIYLQPFLASIIAIYLGKDVITSLKIFSGLCIISGVYIAGLKVKERL